MKNISPERVKVVAFDAFDTTVLYDKNPSTKGKWAYGLLFKNVDITHEEAKKRNRFAMTQNIDFFDLAELVKQTYDNISHDDIINIYSILQQELSTMRQYPDTTSSIQALQNKWYKIALISNLWKAYWEKLDTILPPIDMKWYSYEIWYQKPDKEIFQYIADAMWVQLVDILMIGNHGKHDFSAPISHWMQSLLLDRKDSEICTPDNDKIQSLSELKQILT